MKVFRLEKFFNIAFLFFGLSIIAPGLLNGQEPQNCFSAPEVRNKEAVSPCVLAKITKELGQDQIAEVLYPASRMSNEIVAFGIQICSKEDLLPSLRQSILDPAEIYDRIRFVYPSRQPSIFIRSAECDGESSGPKYSLRVVAFTDQSSIETWNNRLDVRSSFQR